MKDGRFRGAQCVRQNPVAAERTVIHPDAPGTVNLLDLPVGRRLDADDPPAAQQFHDEPVKVFRSRADDDLVRLYADAAVAGQITAQGLPQFDTAGAGRTDHDLFAVFGQHPAHHTGQGREGKGGSVRCRRRLRNAALQAR